jgi:hypothetical protein|tara:strand:- start:536 stop:934 length:399 start_codon:yes stop_codon:yes gene_type:complete
MSADKSTLLKTFNTQFFALLDDILLIFPDNLDIAAGRKSFETIKRANPTIIIKVWMTHVYTPYRQSIDDGDIEYFINKDYGSDLNSMSNVQDVMKVIDTIREPIRSMDDVNKGHTIKYIQILSKLSEMYSKV